MARVHALWSLHGLKALTDEMLIKALSDSSPRVVEHAVRLAEPRLDESPALLERVAALADHDDVRVRFHAALSLGATTDARAADALAIIARRDAADRGRGWLSWPRRATRPTCCLPGWRSSPAFRAARRGASFLEQLAEVIGAGTGRMKSRACWVSAAQGQDPSFVRRAVLALGRGMSRSGGHFALSGQSLDAREPADRPDPRPRRP